MPIKNQPVFVSIDRAIKLLSIMNSGLIGGAGGGSLGDMCVEQAILRVTEADRFEDERNEGEPGDNPKCVHPALANVSIALNDHINWSSNKARAKSLKRFAIAQLDSKATLKSKAKFREGIRRFLTQTILHGITNRLLRAKGISSFLPGMATLRAELSVDPSAKNVERLAKVIGRILEWRDQKEMEADDKGLAFSFPEDTSNLLHFTLEFIENVLQQKDTNVFSIVNRVFECESPFQYADEYPFDEHVEVLGKKCNTEDKKGAFYAEVFIAGLREAGCRGVAILDKLVEAGEVHGPASYV